MGMAVIQSKQPSGLVSRVRGRVGHYFGGGKALSPLIRMDMRSVVTPYAEVRRRYLIGL